MDQAEIIKKLEIYKKLLSQHIKLESLVLFGSYAKGTANTQSDVDVAVIVDGQQGDFFSTRPILWKIRRLVDDRIEPVLIDKKHDDSGFLSEIMKNGVII
ncbi:MAG: nucleotidyltransferase domain-containing protein [Desulfobulbaceae bacterium]|nr:nucleotidyltransferase domain-containing protein [Desulfobulbaceae bacterium]